MRVIVLGGEGGGKTGAAAAAAAGWRHQAAGTPETLQNISPALGSGLVRDKGGLSRKQGEGSFDCDAGLADRSW